MEACNGQVSELELFLMNSDPKCLHNIHIIYYKQFAGLGTSRVPVEIRFNKNGKIHTCESFLCYFLFTYN